MKDVVFLVNICISCPALLLKTVELFQSTITYFTVVVVHIMLLFYGLEFCFQFCDMLNIQQVTKLVIRQKPVTVQEIGELYDNLI